MTKPTKTMPLDKLGSDTTSEMPPVSPQFKIVVTPDPDGKFRDCNGNLFDPERHAVNENGIPIKTPRGYFRLKGAVAPKPTPPEASEENESFPEGPPQEEDDVQTPPPVKTHAPVSSRSQQTPVNAPQNEATEDNGGSKKKSGSAWGVFGIAGIGIALIVIGYYGWRGYCQRKRATHPQGGYGAR